MLTATVLSILLLVAAVGMQAIWNYQFSILFRNRKSKVDDTTALPRVAIVMTLRGADPFLDRTLQSLTRLDYPSFEIHIVVDHRDDPAWSMVQGFVEQSKCDKIHIDVLEDRRPTCSLRMSSLIQAVSGLDESVEVVVIIDADVVAYPNWLRDLVAPLSNPQVGATSGIRWYAPPSTEIGSLVRYLWNVAGMVQMHAFGIGWGGSLAVRRRLLHDAGIVREWSNIMFEDTFTVNEVQSSGSRLQYVPEAIMVNRESIDLAGCTRFISRQVLNARMYHRSWSSIVAYALLSVAALNGSLVTGLAACFLGHTGEAIAIFCALIAYSVGMASLLAWCERLVGSVVHPRGETTATLSWNLIWAGLLTHYVYLTSLIMGMRAKEIEWRGIRYRLSGPRNVQLQQYSPFQPKLAPNEAQSL